MRSPAEGSLDKKPRTGSTVLAVDREGRGVGSKKRLIGPVGLARPVQEKLAETVRAERLRWDNKLWCRRGL